MKNVLLMTATVNPGSTPFLILRDEKERLHQYLCSLISWITLSGADPIVFCENSSSACDFVKVCEFAEREGKTLEVLVFGGNKRSHRYGKGYGEGEIIEHAMGHSKYLTDDVDFYKVTGRLWIPEFDNLCIEHAKVSNVFRMLAFRYEFPKQNFYTSLIRFPRTRTLSRRGPIDRVSTRFYKANVLFFKKHLLRSYRRVHDRWHYFLENAYYDDLKRLHVSTFRTGFSIVGVNATENRLISGLDFPANIKALANTFL